MIVTLRLTPVTKTVAVAVLLAACCCATGWSGCWLVRLLAAVLLVAVLVRCRIQNSVNQFIDSVMRFQ